MQGIGQQLYGVIDPFTPTGVEHRDQFARPQLVAVIDPFTPTGVEHT